LWGIELVGVASLAAVWVVTDVWIGVRAALGMARVWPGIGGAPLVQPDRATVPQVVEAV
jgi:hypothetical protein